MKTRISTFDDVPEIMIIIEDAKTYLASQNIDQWQKGYPNTGQVKNDIKNRASYVVVSDDNAVMATSMFTINKEPTYKVIAGN